MVKNYDTASAYVRDTRGKATTEDVKSVVEPLMNYVELSLDEVENFKSKLSARVGAVELSVENLGKQIPTDSQVSAKDIEILAGANSAIRDDINALSASVNSISSVASDASAKLDMLSNELPTRIEETTAPIKTSVSNIGGRVEELETKILTIDGWKEPINAINTNLAAKASSEVVSRIDNDLFSLKSDVGDARAVEQEHYKEVTQAVTSHTKSIAQLEEQNNARKSALEELQSAIRTLSRTSDVDTKIDQAKSAIEETLTTSYQTANAHIQQQVDDLRSTTNTMLTLDDVDTHLSNHNDEVEGRLEDLEQHVSELSVSVNNVSSALGDTKSVTGAEQTLSDVVGQTVSTLNSLSETVRRNHTELVGENGKIQKLSEKIDQLRQETEDQDKTLSDKISDLEETTTTKFNQYYTKSKTDEKISEAITALNLSQRLADTRESAITAAVTQVLGDANLTESYDTLKEIVDVIESDTHGVAGLITDVSNLKQFREDIEKNLDVAEGIIDNFDQEFHKYQSDTDMNLSELGTQISNEVENRIEADENLELRLNDKIGTLPDDKESLATWIESVETSVQQNIGTLPSNEESVASWIESVEEDLTAAKNAATQSASLLEGQITRLQGTLTTVQTTLGNDTEGIVKDVNILKDAVGIDDPSGESLSSRVTTLEEAVGIDDTGSASLSSRIETAESNVDALQRAVDDLQSDAKTLDDSLQALSNLVGTELPDEYSSHTNIIAWLTELSNNFDSKMFPLEISDVVCSPSMCTTHSTADITLTWKLSREPEQLKIGDDDISDMVGVQEGDKLKYTTTITGVTKPQTGSRTALPQIWAKHRAVEDSETPYVTFTNYIYYWVGDEIDINTTEPIALPVDDTDHITPLPGNGKLNTSVSATITLEANGEDKYYYVAFPKDYGKATFKIGDLGTGGMQEFLNTHPSVTDNGNLIEYRVYKSGRPNLRKSTIITTPKSQ